MKKIIVFEGTDEIIVANFKSIEKIVKLWFLEGQRSLDNYDIYLVDGDEGFSFSSRVCIDTSGGEDISDIGIAKLLSKRLQDKLHERAGGW